MAGMTGRPGESPERTERVECGRAGSRLLVIRPGALGDSVLTEPVIAALRNNQPGATIHLAGRPEYLELLVGGAGADARLDFDGPAFTSLFSNGPVRLPGYDLIVAFLPDPDNRLRDRLRTTAGRAVVLDPRPSGGCHITDHLLSALAPLDIAPFRRRPRITPSAEWQSAARSLVPGDGYAVIHLGSGGDRKLLPTERWAEVIEQAAPVPVLLTCGPADRRTVGDLCGLSNQSGRVTVVAGQPITTIAGLLAGAAIYLGCDSGVTHLAAAVGVPTVALFGPTDPATWAPRGERITVIRGDGGGMASISTESVLRATSALGWPG